MISFAQVGKEVQEGFFTDFFEEFRKVPFGSMAKRDLECYLVQLFYKYELIDTSSNRTAANALGINESRLQNYRIDARYKYEADKKEKNIQEVIKRMQEGLHIESEGENFSFVLEDSILRLDFAQGLKDIGYYSDTSFNNELIKVKNTPCLLCCSNTPRRTRNYIKRWRKKPGKMKRNCGNI
jgi:hypothetical protein